MKFCVVTGKLRLTTALHLGSGQRLEATDAVLLRNAQGQIVLPGTSIGGTLRSLASRLGPRLKSKRTRQVCLAIDPEQSGKPCGCIVCHLFGDLFPGDGDNEGAKRAARASRLWVYDASLIEKQESSTQLSIRDSVGIDRSTRSAASAGAVKFDLETLPSGTEFKFRLELQDPEEEDEALLAAVLAEWQGGRGKLGGRTNRGLGSFILEELSWADLNISQGTNLLAYLKSDDPWSQIEASQEQFKGVLKSIQKQPSPQPRNSAIARTWIDLSFDLGFEGPFLINDLTLAELIGFDHAPLLNSLPPVNLASWQAEPTLPGSALRGVIRSQGEKIARTLATINVQNAEEFLNNCPACDPTQSNKKAPLASCDARLKSVASGDESIAPPELCLACQLFGSTRLGSRLKIDDSQIKNQPVWKPQDFLAIDRFTGGGMDGAKFDALALWDPVFGTRLQLENPSAWEIGWLALILRDLSDGFITTGFGSAKGYGRAHCKNFRLKLGFITEDDLEPLHATSLNNKVKPQNDSIYSIIELAEEDYLSSRNLLEKCVQEFNQECQLFRFHQAPDMVSDTYFGQVDHLYPIWRPK
jgi:CRISPR/Cas system CSM-associated protein Csm3 (group 7 of RAMP superfamily)